MSLLHNIWIYDKELRRHVDVFQLALLDVAEDTLLPELYEIVGTEVLLELLDRFAGTTIKVPETRILREAARNADIFVRTKNGEDRKATARKHGVSVEVVDEIVRRYQDLVK